MERSKAIPLRAKAKAVEEAVAMDDRFAPPSSMLIRQHYSPRPQTREHHRRVRRTAKLTDFDRLVQPSANGRVPRMRAGGAQPAIVGTVFYGPGKCLRQTVDARAVYIRWV
jgi:hypothetical protein